LAHLDQNRALGFVGQGEPGLEEDVRPRLPGQLHLVGRVVGLPKVATEASFVIEREKDDDRLRLPLRTPVPRVRKGGGLVDAPGRGL